MSNAKLKIKIIRDFYDRNENIYDKTSVELKPGVTVLVGCNGSGKTTMLHQIKEHCRKNDIPVLNFDNLHEGGSNSLNAAGFMGNTDFLIGGITSSEGELINMNIGNFAAKMGGFVFRNSDKKEIVFLMDAIDSGLSIDNIIETKELLFKTVLEDCTSKGITVYIVVSANEYELARGEKCLDVTSCKYVDLPTYEDYRKLVIESRKKKNKRYKWDDFNLG